MLTTEESTETIGYSYEESFISSLAYFNGNELAARVFLDKYALRHTDGTFLEKNPYYTHRRLAKEFARIEAKKFKNPLTEDEIFSYFDKFGKIICQGSPTYGIGNTSQYVSLSNCFVIESPEDSYGGICRYDEELAQISKRRGGLGGDISTLRPAKSPTKNSSRTSTGIIPFACRFSNTIREVGQDGRRGAEMISCSIHHPQSVNVWDEIVDGKPYQVEVVNPDLGQYYVSSEYYNPNNVDFVTCKYDTSKVTGANISLRISDEFMNSVFRGTDYQQRWPVDSENPKITKNVCARKAWNKIIHSAWRTAEPGVLFWDTIIKESVADCYAHLGYKTISTNPCGEIPLSAYDSCRLIAINLFGFIINAFKNSSKFDYDEFYETCKIAQRLMDDLVDLELESIDRIIDKINNDPEQDHIKNRELTLWNNIRIACFNGRRTGTGITALGDTIAALNLQYGQKEGIQETEKIYRTLKFACYQSSIDMAKEIGTFPIWDHELEKDNPFLNRIRNESIQLSNRTINGEDIWNEMKIYGRRNIALLTTAPTGTISILAKLNTRFGTSSGIEPQYSIKPYIRKKKGNPSDINFRTDSIDQNGDHWMHFKVYPSSVQEWMDIHGDDITKSPWHNNCAEDLDWINRVELQSVAQKHVDHSISSTINLPESVTVEKVAEIYETAYKMGCKGVTVYRDNCRTGVLVKESSEVKKTNAPKRPKTLQCDVYHTTVRGDKFFVLVGMLNDHPYEIFAGKNGFIPNNIEKAIITKKKRGHYSLEFEDGTVIENVNDHITDEQATITRLASLSLRHGADIKFLVDQLEKTPGDLTNFGRSVARILKKYIPDGTEVSGNSCENCGNSVIRQEGCLTCKSCGWSKCS